MKANKIKRYRDIEAELFRFYGVARQEHFIKIPSLGIQVRAPVTGAGTPILFIHGGPNAGSTWAELASRLPNYQCMLLDRPGCGLSEAVNGNHLSRETLIYWIVSTINGVLDYFQQEKIILVGSSFGGYWALLYTLHRPDRVERLILEGCPAMVEGMAIPEFMKAMTRPVLRWLIPRLPTTPSYARKIMKEIGHTYSVEKNRLSERFVDWYVSLINHTDTMKNDAKIINYILAGGKMNPEFILPDSEIQKITQPTLWLWGEDDPFGGVDIGKRIHSQMQHSELVPFRNSGHLPWLDNPNEHAVRIKEFILSYNIASKV